MATAACGGGSSSSSANDKTITWWHNSNNQPGKGYYEQVAKDFEASHPGVKIKVSGMAHESMVDKLDAGFQSGDLPDVYMERGGGELADHVDAGLVRDLSKDASPEISKLGGNVAGWQVDGKTYALPFSMGVVGFWYNKAQWAKAGLTTAPTTMSELYSDIDKLKAAHSAVGRCR
jgi:raffinose/stachyose/melibiose transport system substrate-binding protein